MEEKMSSEFTIHTGNSALGGSMPSTEIRGVSSHSSLDSHVPAEYQQSLTVEEQAEAVKRYKSYKDAVDASQQYAKSFDDTIADFQQHGQHDYRATKSWGSRGSGGPTYTEEVEDRQVTLDVTGDRYLRAKIDEYRQSKAIKDALDANGGSFPASYVKPAKEWWCTVL